MSANFRFAVQRYRIILDLARKSRFLVHFFSVEYEMYGVIAGEFCVHIHKKRGTLASASIYLIIYKDFLALSRLIKR